VAGPHISEPFTVTVYPGGPGLHTIDQFADGGAISGVYHPPTQSMASLPSGLTRMANGSRPTNIAPRNGAHFRAEQILEGRIPDYRPGESLGFTVFPEGGYRASMSWTSRGVNGENRFFTGDVVPEHMRRDVVDAVEEIIKPARIVDQRARG
jgi:hypothetical protein